MQQQRAPAERACGQLPEPTRTARQTRPVRTTFELDPDVVREIELLRRQRGLTRNQAVNTLLRAGMVRQRQKRAPFSQRTHPLGAPREGR